MTAIPNDFDFEFGEWQVNHRRLRERLVGCTDWESFTGTADVRPILGGNGNIEDNWIEFPEGGYRAIALRSFDAASGTWAIWWLDARFPHQLDTPVTGRFEGDTGTFLARDSLRSLPILVRFRWLRGNRDQPRWEQAFSPDDGATWETNWEMQFRRRSA